jgi:uncharacterized protein
MKLLLIIGVISIVYFMFIKKKPENISKTKRDEKEADEMVECANCGVYAELDESFLSGSKYYCSKECLNAKRENS